MDKARERLDHLKLQYGENDPYYAGFADCLRLVEQTEGGWKTQLPEAEIMQALLWHFDEDKYCEDCPYVDRDEYCHILLKKDVQSVIDLINRKNAKIERLNFENLQMIASVKNLKAEAIKEVIEKAKDTKFKIGNEYVIYADNLDVIAKEMGVE